jgi:diaminohydroxyphosphoribosylaminopyrimidine deaminase / 5-amino-6-(5-phosphoribosylamino)uracil reductase
LEQSDGHPLRVAGVLEDGQRAELEERAWPIVRALCCGAGDAALRALDASGVLASKEVRIDVSAPRGWRASAPLPEPLREMLDLYAPLCARGRARYALGHLGQSVDGFIAGADRQSSSLNDRANIVHLHRLRALFDVVLVGYNTACADNPRLTTRLVPGDNPVRAIVDLRLGCEPSLGVFNDGLAPTLLIAASDAPPRAYPLTTRVLRLARTYDQARLADVLDVLSAEGLSRAFIEGGGRTVSCALQEGLLSRLHVAVAPVLIGDGVLGLRLSGVHRFADALRPPSRTFQMGRDVLFDFELSG